MSPELRHLEANPNTTRLVSYSKVCGLGAQVSDLECDEPWKGPEIGGGCGSLGWLSPRAIYLKVPSWGSNGGNWLSSISPAIPLF